MENRWTSVVVYCRCDFLKASPWALWSEPGSVSSLEWCHHVAARLFLVSDWSGWNQSFSTSNPLGLHFTSTKREIAEGSTNLVPLIQTPPLPLFPSSPQMTTGVWANVMITEMCLPAVYVCMKKGLWSWMKVLWCSELQYVLSCFKANLLQHNTFMGLRLSPCIEKEELFTKWPDQMYLIDCSAEVGFSVMSCVVQ